MALMDYLHVDQAALVGWSDGAIIGLDIVIHHPHRLTRLFAFAREFKLVRSEGREQKPGFSP